MNRSPLPDEWLARRPADLASPVTRPRHGQLPLVALTAIGALSLMLFWVYGYRPLVGEPWQFADDGLYLRQAEALVRWLHGDGLQWLGPYDAVTLAKSPGYAIWLAALYIMHLPLRVAEFALLLLVSWLFVVAVRPLRILSWWQVAMTTTLLSAVPFLPFEQRLLRAALQIALMGGCEAATIGLVLRARQRGARLTPWAALSGLFFALAYLNREEAVWLAPVVVCGLAAIVFGSWWNRTGRQGVLAAAVLVAAVSTPIALVAALNQQSYGVFLTTARRAPAFTRAHQLMTSLEPRGRKHYVPIRESARLKAYALSPTFASLRPYLEGPAGDPFARNADHLLANGFPPTSREYFVSTFQFALQQAAFDTGARTAAASEALFDAMARELAAAIAAGKIRAGNQGPAILGPLLRGDAGLIAGQTLVSLRKLYAFEAMIFPPDGQSSGPLEDRARMAALTHTRLAPTIESQSRDLPEIGAPARRFIYDAISRVEMVAYPAATVVLLAFIAVTAARHRRDAARVDQAFAATVVCGTLLAFALATGAIDVIGFAILRWPLAPYNNLGYGPLSVLSAFGLVVLISWLRPQPHDLVRGLTPDRRESARGLHAAPRTPSPSSEGVGRPGR